MTVRPEVMKIAEEIIKKRKKLFKKLGEIKEEFKDKIGKNIQRIF